MSDHRQAPDLVDELLGFDEPTSTEGDQAERQPEAAVDEPKPRRRHWWQGKQKAVPADASEAEASAEPEPEAEPAPGPSPRRSWLSTRRTLMPEALEMEPEAADQSEEAYDQLPTSKVEEAPSPRRKGGRHLRVAADEADHNGSADGSSDPANLGRADPILPPILGPRAAARERRRTRIRLFVGVTGALLALAAAATVLAPSLKKDPRPQSAGSAAPADPIADPIRTVLLYGTAEERSSEAAWMSLLSLNSETNKGSVVYIPAHTATEVPGRGLLGIGEALGSGPSLLEVSTETLLGVPVDDRLQLTPEGALALFQGIGEISVDVPSELRVEVGEEQARLLIPPGPQLLAPDELVSLLFRPGIDGDDAELGGRHLAFWNGVLNQYTDDSGALTSAVADAEPPLGTAAATEPVGALLSDLAQLPPSSRTLANLPVKEVSVGGDQLYETDPDELSAFVGETVGETDLAADLSRVQVLNGNGVPGIGVDVAEKLVGNGFQVTLSANADRLDYYSTRIISYDSSPEGIAVAREARALLGTGKVQVSSQGQGIVDLTIVVGRDFLRTR